MVHTNPMTSITLCASSFSFWMIEKNVSVEAVMLIDGIQMIIFLAGGVIGSGIAFSLVGGMDGLVNWLKEANLGDFPHLLRPATDESFPWYVHLTGFEATQMLTHV